tara:strand:+ start:10959 stop:12353 length:1395 start_codon:yes stop_codon:yes gene_type:complete
MSEIKSSNVSWNNIKVDQYVDITTGYTYLTLPGQTTKLAESSDANWTILDINLFTRTYNNANSSALTNEEVRTLFFRSGRFVFNKIRADIINDLDNYSSVTEFNQNTLGMFNRGVPGSVNPNDGRRVNDNGQKTEFNVVNRNVRTPSTFQVRTQGSPVIPSSFQGPNTVQLASTGNSNTYKRSSSFGTLRYPAAALDGMDYISMQAFEYSAGGGLLEGGRGTGASIGGGVQLPIPPGATEKNSVDWGGGDRMDFLTAALGDTALNTLSGAIEAMRNDEGIGGMVSKGFSSGAQTAGQYAKNFLNDANSDAFIKAYFAQQAVGQKFITRATGGIINPNLELLFTGPQLRSFSFNFLMTPRDEGESQTVKNIIRYFKKNMRPRKSGSTAFLYTPNVFNISYIYNGGGEHPFMNKFKTCALKGCDVTYGPSMYSTYDDGGLTQYKLNLSFGELLPIYDDDEGGGTGF